MSITADGWIDWATRKPGIPDKVYSQPNSGKYGIACHSWVGEERDFEDGIPNRFLSTERGPDGRYTPAAAASAMFVLRKSGELIQMYPITASTWTSGGREANCNFWAIEAEGGLNPHSEPLTVAATETFIELCHEWEQHFGELLARNITLREHWQIAQKFGYAPTACASGRYTAAWRLLVERRDSMADTIARERAEKALAVAGTLNDVLVIERDLRRAISGPGNHIWRVHKALVEAGLLEPEYTGNYGDRA